MYNDSAIFITGSCALSQSAYVSWGSATGSGTAVGFFQNNNGTLMFKDHASGSWTELGNTRDNTQLGDAAADVITANGQLTASQGASFTLPIDITDTRDAVDNSGDTGALKVEGGASIAKRVFVGTDLLVSGSATFGDAVTDVTTVTGQLTGSQGASFALPIDITDTRDAVDNSGDTGALKVEGGASIAKRVFVGTDLLVSGSTSFGDAAADVTTITGQLTASQGALFNNDARIADNNKLYFGDLPDAYIVYDEASTDELIISGALGGIDIQAPQGVADALTISSNGDAYLTLQTISGYTLFNKDAACLDNVKLYFGTGADASIEHRTSDATLVLSASGCNSFLIDLKDNISTAFRIGEDTNEYMTIVTTNSSEAIKFSEDVHIIDDKKIHFGTGKEAFIEYDEDSTDRLNISGSAAGTQLLGDFHISGHITPSSDNAKDLGSSSNRWANVYTADLHLKNDRGDWTIVEEDNYICVVNNKTNKRYKMMLEEMED